MGNVFQTKDNYIFQRYCKNRMHKQSIFHGKRSIASTLRPLRPSAIIASCYTQSKKFSTPFF